MLYCGSVHRYRLGFLGDHRKCVWCVCGLCVGVGVGVWGGGGGGGGVGRERERKRERLISDSENKQGRERPVKGRLCSNSSSFHQT